MKKAILAPLCSALIIPGLGQVINGQLRKGAVLLGSTFILFLVGIVQLYRTLTSALRETDLSRADPQALVKSILSKDAGIFWLLLGVFALLWVYSVLDAFRTGRKMDRNGVTTES